MWGQGLLGGRSPTILPFSWPGQTWLSSRSPLSSQPTHQILGPGPVVGGGPHSAVERGKEERGHLGWAPHLCWFACSLLQVRGRGHHSLLQMWKLRLRELANLPRPQSLSVAELIRPQLVLIPRVWAQAVENISGPFIFLSTRVVPFSSSVHVKCHQDDSLLLIWCLFLFLGLM